MKFFALLSSMKRPSSFLLNGLLFVYFYSMIQLHQNVPPSPQEQQNQQQQQQQMIQSPLEEKLKHLEYDMAKEKKAHEKEEAGLRGTIHQLEQRIISMRKDKNFQRQRKQQQQNAKPKPLGPKAGYRQRLAKLKAASIIQEEDDPHSYRYNLTAMVKFRVNYQGDQLQFTRDDLSQWITYLHYAGVQHFFLYDACVQEHECVDAPSKDDEYNFANDPRITYVRMNEKNLTESQYQEWIKDYHELQLRVLDHHWTTHHHNPWHNQPDEALSYLKEDDNNKVSYNATSRFEVQLDFDEYPFTPQDINPGFLWRYIEQHLWSQWTDQILMNSWFHGGTADQNNNAHPWRAGRYLTKDPQITRQRRTKAIYRPLHLEKIGVHSSPKGARFTETADESELYLKHLWGERLVLPEGSDGLIHDDSILPLLDKIIAWQTANAKGG